MIWLAVAAGGALGSMARHGVNILFAHVLERASPYATGAVNLIGSAMIGLLAALIATGRLHMSTEARTFVFVAGYVTVWGLFGVLATVAQRGLDALSLLSPTMAANSTAFGGVVLVAAGIYQITPLKRACLKHCRAPAHFLSRYWRKGTLGAFRMGLRLGAYCLGCCWILMALLFVGGVMNLLWIAAISGFVLLEKTLPFGETGSRIAGATAIGAGILSIAI